MLTHSQLIRYLLCTVFIHIEWCKEIAGDYGIPVDEANGWNKMATDAILRFLYFLIIIGVFMVWLLSRRQQRDIRHAVDAFALVFVRISNEVASKSPDLNDCPPSCVHSIMSRAVGKKVVDLYGQLFDANENVTKACGRSARFREQFALPVNDLFDTTRRFLMYCEQKGKTNDPALRDAFSRFLMEQTACRRELFKRISRDVGDEFLKLSSKYTMTD